MSRRISLRDATTSGDSVRTTMLGAAGVEQAGSSVRAPFTSTTQIRQAPVGVVPFKWHNVGISMWPRRATSRIVSPGSMGSSFPLITIRFVCSIFRYSFGEGPWVNSPAYFSYRKSALLSIREYRSMIMSKRDTFAQNPQEPSFVIGFLTGCLFDGDYRRRPVFERKRRPPRKVNPIYARAPRTLPAKSATPSIASAWRATTKDWWISSLTPKRVAKQTLIASS